MRVSVDQRTQHCSTKDNVSGTQGVIGVKYKENPRTEEMLQNTYGVGDEKHLEFRTRTPRVTSDLQSNLLSTTIHARERKSQTSRTPRRAHGMVLDTGSPLFICLSHLRSLKH